MTVWLKQSTAVTIKIGPFVDETDGKTAETGLTISQADVRLSKNGGNMAQKNESTTCTHDEIGQYDCPLDATDTGTLGALRVMVHESGALPVWADFMVCPANVWDSFFGADALQVHANEITAGLITAAAIATGAIDADAIADNAIDAGAIASDAITAAKIADGAIDAATFAAGAITATVIATGAIDADAIADNAIDAGAIAADAITAAKIADGAIDAATFAAGAITAAAIAADAIGASELAADAVAEIADGVWDEALAGHAGAGSAGAALSAAGSAGDPWSTALPGAYGAGTAGKIVGDNINAPIATVDTVVDAIKVKTDYLPSATAGAAGGVFIAGSNAATSVTTALTANITGNLSGSVGSVTGAVGSVAAGGIAAASFAAGAIDAAAIATGAIDADAIADNAIDAGAIATGAIDADAIADNAIDAGAIAAGAITNAKFAAGAIDAAAIADNAIDAGAIASDAIAAAKIATGAITNAKFAAGAIDAAAIATGAIDADALAADAGTELGTAVWATAARTLTAATNVTSTGAAVPITAGGLVSADATAISADTTAADALELQFDGTGVTGGTYPATQAQVSAIGSGTGAALNFAADSDNASAPIKSISKVGTQTNTYANTANDNGVYHIITHATNNIDWVYGFSIGGGRTASKVVFVGYLAASAPATSKSITVSAYNFSTPGWDTIKIITGQAGTTDVTVDIALLAAHTGTGTDAGKVYIRFTATSMAGAVLNTDQLIVAAQNLGQTIGYADGSIWVDTVNGTAGTTPYVNGTADKPVLTWADALTLATSVGIKSFRFLPGSSITLTSSAANMRFVGDATIALNGQSIADALFRDCYTISGTSSGDDAFFDNCGIGDVTLYHCYMTDCRLKGTVTLVAANEYYFIKCSDTVGGVVSNATLVYAANAEVVMRDWRGAVQLNGHAATNTTIIDGAGRVIIDTPAGAAGSITIRGHFPTATGAATFGGTLTDDQSYSESVLVDSTWDELLAGHAGAGSAGAALASATPASVWDLADGVETGLTPRQAMRLFAAALAGKLSGAGTVTVRIRNAVVDGTDRIVATVDASGNRTAISYDLT